MALTRTELISSLQNEVRILLHLAGKIDRTQLDYRPSPKQRSTIELLRFLSIMGPGLIRAAASGGTDTAAWQAAETAAAGRDFDQTCAVIATQHDDYAALLADLDLRVEIEMFGTRDTRGAFIVKSVLCGHAAYRTQLFLYLKASGDDALNSMNLWAGTDAPMPAH